MCGPSRSRRVRRVHSAGVAQDGVRTDCATEAAKVQEMVVRALLSAATVPSWILKLAAVCVLPDGVAQTVPCVAMTLMVAAIMDIIHTCAKINSYLTTVKLCANYVLLTQMPSLISVRQSMEQPISAVVLYQRCTLRLLR